LCTGTISEELHCNLCPFWLKGTGGTGLASGLVYCWLVHHHMHALGWFWMSGDWPPTHHPSFLPPRLDWPCAALAFGLVMGSWLPPQWGIDVHYPMLGRLTCLKEAALVKLCGRMPFSRFGPRARAQAFLSFKKKKSTVAPMEKNACR